MAHFMNLIGELVWPALLFCFGLYYRHEIKTLLSRLVSLSREGAQFAPLSQKSAHIVENQDSDIVSFLRKPPPAFQPLVDELMPGIRRELDKQLNDGATETARNRIATYFIDIVGALILERVYNLIFGSQIFAIDTIVRAGGVLDKIGVKRFYDEAARTYPAVYSNYSFDQWLGFMQSSMLVQIKEEKVSVTAWGRALTPYILARQYNTLKPG